MEQKNYSPQALMFECVEPPPRQQLSPLISSSTTSTTHDARTITPATVKQVIHAAASRPDQPIEINNTIVTTVSSGLFDKGEDCCILSSTSHNSWFPGFEVRFVGRVVQVVRCPSKVDSELDDGTGSISYIYWYVLELYSTRFPNLKKTHVQHAIVV